MLEFRRPATTGLFYALVLTAALVEPAAAQLAQPTPMIIDDIVIEHYAGVTDDLLTAGLGASGLALAAAPSPADPLHPTAAELRRQAIHANYRALIDTTPGGGYRLFFGPNIDAEGQDSETEGLVPGYEALVYARRGPARRNVTIMIQAPDSFDPRTPCIVTAPSSGSRGVYGAIGTAGEWGLKNGCVVAYTDKGTGTGAHDLSQNLVSLITGEREFADVAGDESNFTAPRNDRALSRLVGEFPHRFAFKHAHSRFNPEADWGGDVLDSIRVAFMVMNALYERSDATPNSDGSMRRLRHHAVDDLDPDERSGGSGRFTPANTIVIASSVSNGGGASLRAAEEDHSGLIDGVAVSEPNVNPRYEPFAIVQGDGEPLLTHSRSLFDYTTLLNVYQGCANVGQTTAPLNLAPSAAACASLREADLLSKAELADQAEEAQRIINAYGFLPEQNLLQPSHWFLHVPQAIAVTYANAYGRFGVEDGLCGYSFGATDAVSGAPVEAPAATQAALFATSNGIPPTAGVNLINDDAPGGPREYRASTPDQYLDGALCLRALALWRDPVTRLRLVKRQLTDALRIAEGVESVRASGDLRGRPALIVTGRNDAILPPNHTSRAYFGLNYTVEGPDSGLRYYEVLNAHHLDVLNGLPGFSDKFIPLHYYLVKALDLMLDHLRTGAPLPPSQVVRTVPRGLEGAVAPPISLANLPPLNPDPLADAMIVFAGGAVRIPD